MEKFNSDDGGCVRRVQKRKHEESVHSYQNGEAGQCKKSRSEFIFMECVPGVVCVRDQPRLAILQQKVRDMCRWQKSENPCSRTLYMSRKNTRRLQEMPYRVSWKARGTRLLMLINKRDEIYVFDRNFSCFQIENLSFVKSSNLYEHLEDTLIDGVMVLDKFKEITPRYLIYDIITFANIDVGQQPFFPNRLNWIQREIVEPRIKAIGYGIINRHLEPFSVRAKEFWDIYQSAALLNEKFLKSLGHQADGLIFQSCEQPYTAGPCNNVYKWKPHNMISAIFRMKIYKTECFLFVEGDDKPFGQMKYTKDCENLDNKIVECTLDQQRKWKLLRERTDTTLAYSYNMAVAAVESIKCPVTEKLLLNFIAGITQCANVDIATQYVNAMQ